MNLALSVGSCSTGELTFLPGEQAVIRVILMNTSFDPQQFLSWGILHLRQYLKPVSWWCVLTVLVLVAVLFRSVKNRKQFKHSSNDGAEVI